MPERSSIVEPGADRRVDPLVEVDLVARVQEDPEERVAEVAVDDRLERAARSGRCGARRTTRRPPRSTARRAGRRSRAIPAGSSAASSTTNPARQVSAPQIPNATVNRSPRSIGRSPGLSSPSVARGPAREHQVARQRRPVPVEQARRPRARSCPGRRPAEQPPDAARRSGHAAHSKRASWSTSLMTRSPSAGVDQQVAGVLDAARRRRPAARSSSTRNAGASIGRPVGVRLPADDADACAGPIALVGEDLRERPRPVARLARQAQVLEADPAHRRAARRRPCPQHSLPTRIAGVAVRRRRSGSPPRSAGRSRSGTTRSALCSRSA